VQWTPPHPEVLRGKDQELIPRGEGDGLESDHLTRQRSGKQGDRDDRGACLESERETDHGTLQLKYLHPRHVQAGGNVTMAGCHCG
jgi:hypothetical protein